MTCQENQLPIIPISLTMQHLTLKEVSSKSGSYHFFKHEIDGWNLLQNIPTVVLLVPKRMKARTRHSPPQQRCLLPHKMPHKRRRRRRMLA